MNKHKQTCTRTNEQTNDQTNDQTNNQTNDQTDKQNIFFDSELRICNQANKRVCHLVVLYFKALHRANTTALSLIYIQQGALDGFPTETNGLPYALLGSGTQKGDHIQVELEVISRASMAYPLTCPQHIVGLWIPIQRGLEEY
jgi:hypothetical protein